MMSYGHILRSTIRDEESSIIIERSTLGTLYAHLVHDTECLEKCYYPQIVPGPTPSWSLDIDIFDAILAPIT
jgi:hypothetical protein